MDIKNKVVELLKEYLEAPEAWSDNPMIEVDPATCQMRLCDDQEGLDIENSQKDYWEVLDLLSMSTENPGEWDIDYEAVEDFCLEYSHF